MPDPAPQQPRPIAGVKLPTPLLVGPKARDDFSRFKEDWDDYVIIQGVTSKPDDVQVALFHTALSADGKMLLRNQPTPIDPTTNQAMDINKVSTLMKMLKIAVVGEVNETYETYVFRTRVQKETENIDEFVTILRELVQTCGCVSNETRLVGTIALLRLPLDGWCLDHASDMWYIWATACK